ncbi:ABC transporter substrate-binding protein [Haloplanus halophilus]|uniref:ABC transporter substrate-binding protein n=1 Tax=Haloplanus halophilus TaxID=2949993 RepID=UPI00204149B4|nr:ABC transporter substrate-binding protein [Haloplanus sp. GDY1]
MRVVSLLPSATETLAALGVDPVGVSHSCDYPPSVRDRPTVTGTRIEHENRSSREIDEQMGAVEGAVYDLHADRLEALDPDLVVTQATCDVCAVEASAAVDAVSSRGLDADVLTLDPHSLGDVLDDLRRIGAAVNRGDEAERLRERLRDRVESVRSSVDDRDRPRTALLDWTDPPIRGGHWVREMVRLAGGEASFQPDGPSEPVAWDDLRAYDPERLIVAPCGFPTERAHDAATTLAARTDWTGMSAAESGAVYAVDGNALFNRPGPRLVDSLELLADCLHPDRRGASPGTDARTRRVASP